MSDRNKILDKLKVKPIPKKSEQIEIKIVQPAVEEKVALKTKIIDQTKDSDFDRNSFLTSLQLKVVSQKPKDISIISEPIPPKPKSKKLKTKLKLIPEASETTKTQVSIPKERRTKAPEEKVIAEIDTSSIKIGDTLMKDRLPTKDKKVLIRANGYYMNNRETFINFINALFKPYKEEIKDQSTSISCENKGSREFELLTHQKIVRDYLNIYTPYRGLLLYHGLGSGKTCSSIAIAEGLKTQKKIIVMTPASLRRNFLEELKNCGDKLFKKNQYWQFVSILSNKDLVPVLSSVLNLPEDFIIKHGGAWLVNVKEKSNFDQLTAEQKKKLDLQLNEMISVKYQFINYNGLQNRHLRTLTLDYSINPFDDKVIVIDEAHNFVSRIVNKLQRPESLSMRLYEYLLSAKNARIIFLSGTPIINYPNEIAILFNILRGYIKTWNIPLNIKTSRKIGKEEMKDIFKDLNILDYLEYKPSTKMLTVTRNPFGFINVEKDGTYKGVTNFKAGKRGELTDEEFERIIASRLEKNDISIFTSGIKIDNYKALPDNLTTFQNLFLNPETGSLKNENLFKRRILGLTSYFRSAQEQLMPSYNKDVDLKIMEIPMSDYQFGVYEKARAAERKLEESQAKKRARLGDLFTDSVSTYRIFSRAFCNYVFPPDFPRPMPKDGEDIESAITKKADEDILDDITAEERINNPDGLYGADDLDVIESDAAKVSDKDYSVRLKAAYDFLDENKEKYLNTDQLEIYSPKFLNILENVQDKAFEGLHLIYSQFRTLEGIGILKLVFEANGFTQFKIKKNETGEWDLDISEENMGKPTFALYTGTEEADEKEIIRNIYNSDWDYVPETIVSKLRIISSNNFYGNIIKLLMISASGAEGISLKNTRYVHIVEPYWHPVRIEQVIGRARRICSHQNLPPEYRTVSVFIYLMKFDPSQITGDRAIQLRLKDRSKKDKTTPLTSDQALFEIATIKEDINNGLLESVKSASIDCSLYKDPNSKEQIKCFGFGKVSPYVFAFKPSIEAEELNVDLAQKKRVVEWEAKEVKIPINGKSTSFAYNPSTGEVYDLDSFNLAKETEDSAALIKVGDLVKQPNGKTKFIKA